MIDRYVATIFCDDIRHEVNGKFSYIGVYSSKLYVQSFPATLPKLCLNVQIITPVRKPLRYLKLTVYKDEDILQEIPLKDDDLEKVANPPDEDSDVDINDQVQVAMFQLIFSPLQIEAPCRLKVRVKTEEGEMKGLGLRIEKFPVQQ